MNPSTDALAYERLDVKHAAELYGGLLDGRLYPYIPESPPKSLAALQREFERLSSGAPEGRGEVWLNWVIRERASNTCVGTLQATRLSNGLHWVGYKVVPAAWGRGIATSALSWLAQELRREFAGQPLLASVDTRNIASIPRAREVRIPAAPQEAAELHGRETEDFIFQFNGQPNHAA